MLSEFDEEGSGIIRCKVCKGVSFDLLIGQCLNDDCPSNNGDLHSSEW